MPGPPTTFTWNWGAPNQDRNDRYNQQGELTELKNCRYTEGGAVEKRLGQVSTAIDTFVGGTYQGPATQLECADTLIWRDSADQLWCRDPDDAKAYFRGEDVRAFPRWFQVENRANRGGARKPFIVEKDGDLWRFDLGCYDNVALSDAYQLTVVDPTTGTVKLETTIFAADGITGYTVVTDGAGAVWFLYVTGGAAILAQKFTSPTTPPVLTTYDTVSGAAFVSIDAVAYPGSPNIIVVANSSKSSGGDRVTGIYRSYASTAGGVATASDFDTSTCAGGAAAEAGGGISILNWDMSDGFYHVVYWRNLASDPAYAELMLEKVTALTPATTVAVSLFAATAILDNLLVAVASGYVDEVTGNRVVYATAAQLFGSDDTYVSKNQLRVWRFVYDGVSAPLENLAFSASLASKPFKVGDRWFFLTHFDDDDNFGDATLNLQTGIQNGYFVRDEDGRIVCSVLDGEAGFAFFGTLDDDGIQRGGIAENHLVTPVALSATEVCFPLLDAGIVRTRPGRTIATVDFAAVWFSSAPGILPSGIPKRVSQKDVLAEISPIHAPYCHWTVSFTPGGTSISVYVTYLYKGTDSDGNVYRSAPYPVPIEPYVFDPNGAAAFSLPTCRHVAGLTIEIELYGSVNGQLTPYLQDSVLNDPFADTVTLTTHPFLWKVGAEPLYTTGGGLANIAPVPARLAWTQGSRTMLGGTPSGEVWPSREWQQGRGPEFNQTFNFDTNKFGVGELKAAIEIDANSSALFKASGIAIATGAPDGRGSGGWVVQDLHVKKGCSNPAAVTRGPLGVYFPDHETGRMQLLEGNVVRDIATGMVAYKAFVWTSAVDCPDEQLIRWTATNGKRLELHYGYPPADATHGTWILAEGDGLVAAEGANLIGGAHVALTAGEAGVAYTFSPSPGVTDADFLDDGEEVLVDMVSSRMSPAGFMGEFDTDTTTVSSTWLGGVSTYEYSMIPARGAPEVHPDIASEDADVAFSTACFHQRDVRMRIRETSATGRGRRFDGVAILILAYGRITAPYRQIG